MKTAEAPATVRAALSTVDAALQVAADQRQAELETATQNRALLHRHI